MVKRILNKLNILLKPQKLRSASQKAINVDYHRVRQHRILHKGTDSADKLRRFDPGLLPGCHQEQFT